MTKKIKLGLGEYQEKKPSVGRKSKWSPEDEDKLIKAYTAGGLKAACAAFPELSYRSIQGKVYYLEINGRVKRYERPKYSEMSPIDPDLPCRIDDGKFTHTIVSAAEVKCDVPSVRSVFDLGGVK